MRIFLALLITFAGLNSFAQESDSLLKLADNIYCISGHGGNITFLTTDEGVLVVDAGTIKSDGTVIEKIIKSITDKPIKYLVFTHYHYDHVSGASGFSVKPIIISHKNTTKNLSLFGEWFLDMYRNYNIKPKVEALKTKMDSLKNANNPTWRVVEKEYLASSEQLKIANETYLVYPDITFTDKMTLYLGNDTINLIYRGATHTDDNILVEFSNKNVLVTGDFYFNHALPYIDFRANCNTSNWIAQLEEYGHTNYDIVVPGHGKISKPAGFLELMHYIIELKREVIAMVDKKMSLEEIQNTLKLEKYSDFDFQFMLKGEIEAVYNEYLANKKM